MAQGVSPEFIPQNHIHTQKRKTEGALEYWKNTFFFLIPAGDMKEFLPILLQQHCPVSGGKYDKNVGILYLGLY
jgi:hypothetical protein